MPCRPLHRLAASLLWGLLLGGFPRCPVRPWTQPDLPVQISADSAQMDDRQGIGTYTGNVVVSGAT
jgi:lipopolysaccharide export system protein LptA